MEKEKTPYPLNLCERLIHKDASKITDGQAKAIMGAVHNVDEESHALLMYYFRDKMSCKEIAGKTLLGTEKQIEERICAILMNIYKNNKMLVLFGEED